jgi:hypothetical protein
MRVARQVSATAIRPQSARSEPDFLGAENLAVAIQAGKTALSLPFDAVRAQYAGAVSAGFIRRSMIASGRFERALGSIEQLVLGPLARRV